MEQILASKINTPKKFSLWLPMLVAGLLLIGVLLSGCAQASSPSAANSSNSLGAPAPSASAPATAPDLAISDNKTGYDKTQATISQVIADGNYTEPVTYMSPGGKDELMMSVVVKGDVITSVSITPTKADNKSMMYMSNYNKNIQPLVVGKKINELNLPKNVAGSSLTNGAFKQYVADLIAKY
ncbi:Uncharacterised protein [uncultured archaeon]|nr:Uncharacterised protein [uncultured archaeon]